MRRYRRVAAVILGILVLVVPTASASGTAAITLVWGTFRAHSPEITAVTHDQALVPAGAGISVLGLSGPSGTTVTLSVRGLVPRRDYGAHVHTRACGQTPAASGPHFQHRPDPRQPSTDPAYANRVNEIWLDFSTDALGNATARAAVNWVFAGRPARSVVIHEHHTHTGAGVAGTAGARIACVNVRFR